MIALDFVDGCVASLYGEVGGPPDTRVHFTATGKVCIHLVDDDSDMPYQMLFAHSLIEKLERQPTRTLLEFTPAHMTFTRGRGESFVTLRVDQVGTDFHHAPDSEPCGRSWTYRIHPCYWVGQPTCRVSLGVWPD